MNSPATTALQLGLSIVIILSGCGGSNTPTTVAGSGINATAHSATLTWTASTSSDVVGYNVYRGRASLGTYTKITATPLTDTTYTDSSVVPGATYCYAVTAVDSSGGESGPSTEACAVIPTQ